MSRYNTIISHYTLLPSAQAYLGVPQGTIRATVLLETITAAFEMEEILYELKDHSVGVSAQDFAIDLYQHICLIKEFPFLSKLNCGRCK